MSDTDTTQETQKNNSPEPAKSSLPAQKPDNPPPSSAKQPFMRPSPEPLPPQPLPFHDPDILPPPPPLSEQLSNLEKRIRKIAKKDLSDLKKEFGKLAEKWILNILLWEPLEGEVSTSEEESEMDLVSLKDELVQGLKELNFLLYQARTNQQKEIKNHLKAASTACKMLGGVLRNRPFRNSIKNLAEIREQNAVEFVKITINELTKFIKKESELLNYYGLPNADMYVIEGLSTLGRIVDGEVSYTYVLKAIDDLRIEACNLHRNLENQTPSAMNFERTKQIIVKLSMGIGAIIIVIINVQAEAEGKLTPIQATLSGHIASGIIGAAAADIWSLASSV